MLVNCLEYYDSLRSNQFAPLEFRRDGRARWTEQWGSERIGSSPVILADTNSTVVADANRLALGAH